jgi:Rps23 Pro-64 3,4-dihydroxylase Tpa1-like proline 4-hydroxylase
MRANQILNGFSETLMQDERILSSGERELLTSILQNAGIASGGNPKIHNGVLAAMHRAVGETVAQRAFTLLGGSIVEQILATTSSRTEKTYNLGQQPAGTQPPSGPAPPSVKSPPVKDEPMGPAPPSIDRPPMTDEPGPAPPSSPASGPHGLQPFSVEARGDATLSRTSHAGLELLKEPHNVPAQCVVLDEFLAPPELDELMRYTLHHESAFHYSEVVLPGGDEVNYSHRRSRVCTELGKHRDLILKRIRAALPRVLQQLGMESFSVSFAEAQITASNDGDFFHIHSDDGQPSIASRQLTFVYFFHREPVGFEDGELRLHDAICSGERYVSAGSYQTIVPRQNQIVFFPCLLPHEITPVTCPSRAFADSRFTVNGWLHQ